MAALEFPSAGLVANVTTYTANGVTYLWNGSSWVSHTGTGYVGSSGYTGSAGSGYTGSAGAGGGGAISVYNQGVLISSTTTSLNFVGYSVTATSVGSTSTISIDITDDFARTIALLSV